MIGVSLAHGAHDAIGWLLLESFLMVSDLCLLASLLQRQDSVHQWLSVLRRELLLRPQRSQTLDQSVVLRYVLCLSGEEVIDACIHSNMQYNACRLEFCAQSHTGLET